MNTNRIQIDFSDERRRDGLLRSAWMKVVDGFGCRPNPRGPWDETATGDQTPWKYVIAPIRAAIVQAVQSGDKQLIETTLQGALAFCEELQADFASLVPAPLEESIVAVALEETHLEGPANQVTLSLASNPTRTEAERAIGPLSAHLSSLVQLVDRCRRMAREPQVMRQW